MKLDLGPKLEKLDRIASYTFGIVAGLVIVTGTVVAVQHIQENEARVQAARAAKDKPQRIERTTLPNVHSVVFRFPYMHGDHPKTISYLAAMSQQAKQQIPGGFVIDGHYRSQNTYQPTTLTLKCQTLCQLTFKMPGDAIELPYKTETSTRWYTPKRNFELHAGGHVLTIENSRLIGVSQKDEEAIYPFQNHQEMASRENYFNATGVQVKPQG